MDKANYTERRKRLLSQLGENEMVILYSGIGVPSTMDEYFPFAYNRHFFYLTGLRRENMALLLSKTGGREREILFIEQPVPQLERWTGKRVTVREAKAISGCGQVQFIQTLMPLIERIFGREFPEKVWMDCHRESMDGVPFYNQLQAEKLLKLYPAMHLYDIHPVISRMRMNKDAEEIAAFGRALDLTHQGLRRVLGTLRPGMMEYAVQAEFEYEVRRKGAEDVSFPTIVGSGINGCSLHYETNQSRIEEGSLVLLDLGARVEGYCADISRTYPASGHFTEQQRRYYDLVLRANREVARLAAPGKTLTELNNRCKEVLAGGLLEMGKIRKAEEVGRYFMHGVSHFIGLDTHDVCDRLDRPLEPGMIISDEPGLYLDEEAIGIRIEDDLLITEDGCLVLSEAIERTAEEIEAACGAWTEHVPEGKEQA
ncbi:MAG: aminopeptidase P N-terminal domain-containing protein [Clostridia bacterium]|nr:aminopeptidase P N-terminal domain-containing protein [Clostridia bacterium]